MDYTIAEDVVLPSKGLVYDRLVEPNFKLRSLSTEEEMYRLAPSKFPYKVMSEIIESCICSTNKPKISVYDMCLGDYQYLLYKLRIVTYGPDYKIAVKCPICGAISICNINLDNLVLSEYKEGIKDLLFLELPVTKKKIELKMQTPRILDSIEERKREILSKTKDSDKQLDPSFLLTLMSFIKKVDGEELNLAALEHFVKKLPMKDANLLMQTGDKLNKAIGIETLTTCKCEVCGNEIPTPFRITSEFFRPTIY